MWTYSASAASRDDRLAILDYVQQAIGDASVVEALRRTMDATPDVEIDVVITGQTLDTGGASNVNISVISRKLWMTKTTAVKVSDTLALWFGHLRFTETARMADGPILVTLV